MNADIFGGCFKGKRVLVTGHTGFKGFWLSTWLLELGANVTGYALRPHTDPSGFDLCRLQGRMDDRYGNIKQYPRLAEAIAEIQPEIVFHLAAQAIVRRGYRHPLSTLATNIMGTANLLEALRQAGNSCSVVVVTSDKCYKESLDALNEDDKLGGHDPYSASKACAEIVTSAYRRSYFADSTVKVATARAGNVIGGGDWGEDRLVPDVMRSIQRSESVVLRNPTSIRPWQFVLEPLSGYLALAAKLIEGEPVCEAWNFGPSKIALTARYLVEHFVKAWGEGSWEDGSCDIAPHEAPCLVLDSRKARERLGWRTHYNDREMLEATVAWYKAAQEGGDMYAFTAQQIKEYCEK